MARRLAVIEGRPVPCEKRDRPPRTRFEREHRGRETGRATAVCAGLMRSGDILHHHFPDVVALALQHRPRGVDRHPDHGLR